MCINNLANRYQFSLWDSMFKISTNLFNLVTKLLCKKVITTLFFVNNLVTKFLLHCIILLLHMSEGYYNLVNTVFLVSNLATRLLSLCIILIIIMGSWVDRVGRKLSIKANPAMYRYAHCWTVLECRLV